MRVGKNPNYPDVELNPVGGIIRSLSYFDSHTCKSSFLVSIARLSWNPITNFLGQSKFNHCEICDFRLCVHLDALVLNLCVQNEHLASLDAMTRPTFIIRKVHVISCCCIKYNLLTLTRKWCCSPFTAGGSSVRYLPRVGLFYAGNWATGLVELVIRGSHTLEFPVHSKYTLIPKSENDLRRTWKKILFIWEKHMPLCLHFAINPPISFLVCVLIG